MVSKFKNSVLVQKSIKSAIQRHLFFFSSEIDQERDPKTFIFFQFRNRTRARSKDIYFFFRNRSIARSKDFIFVFRLICVRYFFFRSSSELVSKFKNSSSEIDQERDHLFFFSSEIDQERDPKTFIFFQFRNRTRARSKDI